MKLMYITNQPSVAQIAQAAGVDRIFVDLEYIGKDERQGGMDTVQNRHTVADVKEIRKVATKAELLVRINPIHDAAEDLISTEEEIEQVICAGADIIMLPFFKTAAEVKRFISAVKSRAKTMLLFETPMAVENIDEILEVDGIDEVYIGLNDLSLGLGKKFMFIPLADGTVDEIIEKFKQKRLPFGFGGVASLGNGMLPSEKIIAEHYRLGSDCVILSRSFCNTKVTDNIENINTVFSNGIKQIRGYESFCSKQSELFFAKNREDLVSKVEQICNSKA